MPTYTDTFTEATGTPDLTTHTPDSGGSWTERERTGTAAVAVVASSTDTCRPSDSTSTASVRTLYTVSWTPAGNEYDVSFVGSVISTRPSWLIARYTGVASFYAAGVYPASGNPDLKIVKVTAGPTRTLLASANVGPTGGATFKFEVRDAAKKLFEGATERLSSTDNAITDVGVVGLGQGNIGDAATDGVYYGYEVDNFTLVDASVASGGNPWYAFAQQ